ncbi:MAG: hypothetical protein ACREDK_09330, partial [Thermoplasmata archaeon]
MSERMRERMNHPPASDLRQHRATSILVLAGAVVLVGIAILGTMAPAGGRHSSTFANSLSPALT